MTHTPGPWKVVHPRNCNNDTFHPCIHANAKGFGEYHIAQTFFISPDEMEDNARLIAAAPELLKACKELIDAMVHYQMDVDEDPPMKHRMMMERARTAIAKAEGK